MKVFPFDLPTDEDVIIVNASIEGKFRFRLALDTAATHTTIDSNILYFPDYELKKQQRRTRNRNFKRNYSCWNL